MRLRRQMQQAGLPGDAYTLTALLTACERVGKWQEALCVEAEFRAAGLPTNKHHHNCLLSAFSRAEQWELVSRRPPFRWMSSRDLPSFYFLLSLILVGLLRDLRSRLRDAQDWLVKNF